MGEASWCAGSGGRPENHWQTVTVFLETIAPVFSGRPFDRARHCGSPISSATCKGFRLSPMSMIIVHGLSQPSNIFEIPLLALTPRDLELVMTKC